MNFFDKQSAEIDRSAARITKGPEYSAIDLLQPIEKPTDMEQMIEEAKAKGIAMPGGDVSLVKQDNQDYTPILEYEDV